MALSIDETARNLLSCVCDHFEEIGRPFCTCAATVGSPVLGPQCNCKGGNQGEAWVNFTTMYTADYNTLQQSLDVFPCRRSTTVAEFQVTITRCFPTVSKTGQPPSAEKLDDKATEYHQDIQDLWSAITCCASQNARLFIRAFDFDEPQGGMSIITALVVVEVSPRRSPIAE